MDIIINRESKTPIYLQIKKQIEHQIAVGKLPANFILPAERTLSMKLGVNRSTVVKAYMELKADGLVESRIGSGTVVLAPLTKDIAQEKMYIPPLRWGQLESKRSARSGEQTINNILSVFEKERIISFASGISSEDACDINLMKNLHIQIIEKYREKLFMPTPVDGSIELKTAIKAYIQENGINAGTKQIMVTSGSQQSIEFFARTIIEPGDVVLVEEPTYIGAIQAFQSYDAKIIGIPMDDEGIRLDILESCLIKYRPKFIYTQPNFHNPTGISMSLERRKGLLKLAYYYNLPILEDDPYGELYYSGNPLPSLKSLDNNDYVVYLSSFSKTISFSLRVGFVVASENIIGRFIQFKQITDIQTSTHSQFIINEFLNGGHMGPHLDYLRKIYKDKRDLMLNELNKSNLDGMTITVPNGGYFIWLRLPDYIRMNEFVKGLADKGVVVMLGDIFYPGYSIDGNYIRLNFSYPSEKYIKEGISILKNCIKQYSTGSLKKKYEFEAEVNPFL
ncbi:PLP-dependent aminotransferase family protein [Clostridium sp. BNL1100]|uniref:MocR-like pyridoxine biosynthesis transcription factor PdxR n=1 Tax=Clostridium sp. BNL1100 TaxID=755731 RepID=UPI00024A73D6|nr:PLP-dependent aminotransferase family protein [Clostridium sp. BNL1100]AEY66393.1 transcriptional regulator with HTH domain and aminotransferase domain [Clostridium sp. BNL1100]